MEKICGSLDYPRVYEKWRKRTFGQIRVSLCSFLLSIVEPTFRQILVVSIPVDCLRFHIPLRLLQY